MFATFLQVADWGKYPSVDQNTPSSRNQVILYVMLWIYHDRQFLLIELFARTIASKNNQFFIYFCCRQGIRFMKQRLKTLYRMRSPSWWEIVKLESLQTRWGCYKRQGKKKWGADSYNIGSSTNIRARTKDSIVVTARKQVDVSYRIKM